MPTEDRKTCSKCGVEKPLTAYYMEKGKPRARCKACHKANLYALREDREAYNAKRRDYTARNPDKIKAASAKFRAEHKDRLNAERRDARAANPEKYRAVERAAWDRNKNKTNAGRREAWATDPELRARQRAWIEANSDKILAADRARRARMTDAEREVYRAAARTYYSANSEKWEPSRRRREARKANVEHQSYTRREIYERDGGECRGCGKNLEFKPRAFQIDHIVPISLAGPDIPSNLQLMCPKCNRAKWANLEGQIHLPV